MQPSVSPHPIPNLGSARTSTLHLLFAASPLHILGVQSAQAALLLECMQSVHGLQLTFVPNHPRFPRLPGWLQPIKYVHTVLTSLAYMSLLLAHVPRPGQGLTRSPGRIPSSESAFSRSHLRIVTPATKAANIVARTESSSLGECCLPSDSLRPLLHKGALGHRSNNPQVGHVIYDSGTPPWLKRYLRA